MGSNRSTPGPVVYTPVHLTNICQDTSFLPPDCARAARSAELNSCWVDSKEGDVTTILSHPGHGNISIERHVFVKGVSKTLEIQQRTDSWFMRKNVMNFDEASHVLDHLIWFRALGTTIQIYTKSSREIVSMWMESPQPALQYLHYGPEINKANTKPGFLEG